MWENPVIQFNSKRLRELGFQFVGPGYGELALGRIGSGRFISIEEIVGKIKEILYPRRDLLNQWVVVTAGEDGRGFWIRCGF